MSDIPCNECKYESDCFPALKLVQKVKNVCRQSQKRMVRIPRPKEQKTLPEAQ